MSVYHEVRNVSFVVSFAYVLNDDPHIFFRKDLIETESFSLTWFT